METNFAVKEGVQFNSSLKCSQSKILNAMIKNLVKTEYLIIGAGFYGLYAADILSNHGMSVIVLEKDSESFTRASYINQARIHNGYHYPRSLATAKKTREFFDRFHNEYGFCIHSKFDKIYAISKNFSLTNPEQFENFCKAIDIPYEETKVSKYFNPEEILTSYITNETTYDAKILANYLVNKLLSKKVILNFNESVIGSKKNTDNYYINSSKGNTYQSPNVLNTTYAGINQINRLFNVQSEKVKYELCEVILVNPNKELKNIGLTIMDGPFVSLMPFGKSNFHSLTAVTYTPIRESSGELPEFPCQEKELNCSKFDLSNCNSCPSKPETEFYYMNQIAKKYISPNISYTYEKSLFTIKTVLLSSEIDDSRPTVIRNFGKRPNYKTVFSGKINTVFDLEDELLNEI